MLLLCCVLCLFVVVVVVIVVVAVAVAGPAQNLAATSLAAQTELEPWPELPRSEPVRLP